MRGGTVQGFHAFWEVLDFSENFKDLENEFGPGIYLWLNLTNMPLCIEHHV